MFPEQSRNAEDNGTNAQDSLMVIKFKKKGFFDNDAVNPSGIRQHAVLQLCDVLLWYLLVILGGCAGGGGCVRGGELFALIIHLRKTVVYILNTLIPQSTSSLPPSFPAHGALITFRHDAVILRRRKVGEWKRKTDSEKDGNKTKCWWYVIPPVVASGSPPPHPHKPLKYHG